MGREEQVRDAKCTRPSLPVEGLAPRLLVLACGGVELLTSPLMSGNHAESSLFFVDSEVA